MPATQRAVCLHSLEPGIHPHTHTHPQHPHMTCACLQELVRAWTGFTHVSGALISARHSERKCHVITTATFKGANSESAACEVARSDSSSLHHSHSHHHHHHHHRLHRLHHHHSFSARTPLTVRLSPAACISLSRHCRLARLGHKSQQDHLAPEQQTAAACRRRARGWQVRIIDCCN